MGLMGLKGLMRRVGRMGRVNWAGMSRGRALALCLVWMEVVLL
jgi:hypothetical protein